MTWPQFRRALRAVNQLRRDRRAEVMNDMAIAFAGTQSKAGQDRLAETIDELTR